MSGAVSLIGVPSDLGNGVAPGARDAPAALRRAAGPLPPRVRDAGDVNVTPGAGMEALQDRVRRSVALARARGERPLVLGGDHSVTLPVVEALATEHAMAVLWLDAHTDLDELTAAHVLNHKNVLRHILGLAGVTRIVHVGHRGYTVDDELSGFPDRLVGVTAGTLREDGVGAALDLLSPRTPVYVSVDIDVLDPSAAPGTSTPVPGGLCPGELQAVLGAVGAHREMVGADLVEVNPAMDREGRTVRVAADALAELARCLVRAPSAPPPSRPPREAGEPPA